MNKKTICLITIIITILFSAICFISNKESRIELNNCSLCGEHPKFKAFDDGYIVRCPECWLSTESHLSKEESAKIWNEQN